MNGGLTVTENLADIGGISLAHDALMNYLKEHPDENVEIDGFTPSQRCFIAFSQLWAEKRSDGSMRVQLEDNHAPNIYRAVAPLQHLDAFYEAFEINEGDSMWLAPEERVDIW
jgi:predicted metalloendopeptidase